MKSSYISIMAEKKLFNLLLTDEEKEEIQKYSEMERQNMSHFMIKATFDRIKELKKEEKVD